MPNACTRTEARRGKEKLPEKAGKAEKAVEKSQHTYGRVGHMRVQTQRPRPLQHQAPNVIAEKFILCGRAGTMFHFRSAKSWQS